MRKWCPVNFSALTFSSWQGNNFSFCYQTQLAILKRTTFCSIFFCIHSDFRITFPCLFYRDSSCHFIKSLSLKLYFKGLCNSKYTNVFAFSFQTLSSWIVNINCWHHQKLVSASRPCSLYYGFYFLYRAQRKYPPPNIIVTH